MTVSQVHQILTQWISQRKSFLSSCVSYENIPYKHRSSSGMLSVCEELSTASCRLIYHFGKLTNLVFWILFPLSRSLISSFTDNKGKNCFLNLTIKYLFILFHHWPECNVWTPPRAEYSVMFVSHGLTLHIFLSFYRPLTFLALMMNKLLNYKLNTECL